MSPAGYDHVDAAPHGYNHGNDADVDKVAVTCKQSEASAEALACEDRQHKFQKESQLACAWLHNVECQAAECEQRLTEKLKVPDMEILCLQRSLEDVETLVLQTCINDTSKTNCLHFSVILY